MKTIKELNQKMWYRTMKVLAFIPILYAITGILYTIILFIIPNLFGNERAELIVVGAGVSILLLVEFIKRAVYYISLGEVFPSKE